MTTIPKTDHALVTAGDERLMHIRDDLRELPELAAVALKVAREISSATECQPCPEWCTPAAAEAVIVCVTHALKGMAFRVYDAIGEDDSALNCIIAEAKQ